MAEDLLTSVLASGSSALLLQEVQRGVVGEDAPLAALSEAWRSTGAADRAALLAKAARAAGVPVVHCTAENSAGDFGVNRNARLFLSARRAGLENRHGSDAVQPLAELGPTETDIILPRLHGLSPMTGSPLDFLLRNQGIEVLVVAGVSLNVAIPNLVFDAVNRSYRVVVASDAVVGVPVEFGHSVLSHSLSLVATLADAQPIVACWQSGMPQPLGRDVP